MYRYSAEPPTPRRSKKSSPSVASWLSEIAQKNGISAKNPRRPDVPNTGGRRPVWRSRRIAAAKNGKKGISGTPLAQKDAFVP